MLKCNINIVAPIFFKYEANILGLYESHTPCKHLSLNLCVFFNS